MSAHTVPTPPLVLTSLSEELARALGSLVGADATIAEVPVAIEPAWGVAVRVGEPVASVFTVGMSRDDAVHVARTSSGASDDPSERAILDIVHELVGQAVEALRQKGIGADLLFCVESPEALHEVPAGRVATFEVSLFGDLAPRIGIWTSSGIGATQVVPDVEVGAPSALPSDPQPSLSWAPAPVTPAPASPANLDVILDIDLPLSVRFGQTEMTLNAITRLGPGSVIDLGRSPDDPVEVLVNGRLVARGEVVVVGGNYGVRILEVVSTADRVRSMGN